MEVSGIVFRPLPCFSSSGVEVQSSKVLAGKTGNVFSGEVRMVCYRKQTGGYSDNGHAQNYVSAKAGLKKEEKKKESVKKKLKLVKGLSKDLLMLSSIGFGVEVEDGLIADVKGKKISEATDILLAQLQQLRAEEKEMKKKKKEEKAKLKAAQKRSGVACEPSWISSESSDNDCGNVVDDMNLNLNLNLLTSSPTLLEETVVQLDGIEDQSSANVSVVANRIEVCMGGKCKKAGAPALLEEFERRVGAEGDVVGCKCMGKCRDGPNVRVSNQFNGDVVERKPLCIGVGLEDVGVIVADLFGDRAKDFGLMAA